MLQPSLTQGVRDLNRAPARRHRSTDRSRYSLLPAALGRLFHLRLRYSLTLPSKKSSYYRKA